MRHFGERARELTSHIAGLPMSWAKASPFTLNPLVWTQVCLRGARPSRGLGEITSSMHRRAEASFLWGFAWFGSFPMPEKTSLTKSKGLRVLIIVPESARPSSVYACTPTRAPSTSAHLQEHIVEPGVFRELRMERGDHYVVLPGRDRRPIFQLGYKLDFRTHPLYPGRPDEHRMKWSPTQCRHREVPPQSCLFGTRTHFF